MAETARPRGVYAAALTPFTDADEVDIPRLIAHCRWLLANGCDGLAPLGTTGEANSQPLSQRRRLVEALAGAGFNMRPMIIGTGSCAIADAIEMTRAVLAAGCPNVLVLPPWYYKNPSTAGLHAFFARLIDQVADNRLRLYLYHFPQQAVVPISPELIEALRKSHGTAVIAGLKDSSGDWNNTKMLIDAFPGFDVFSGSEHFLNQNLVAGGPGCISATTNVTAPLAQRVLLAKGAEAERLQEGLSELRLTIQAYPLIAALKHIKAELTGQAAWRRGLPPNMALTRQQGEELMAKLRATREFAALADTIKAAA
jgi:4-hydroxy-tetrahydrodipicolinate synthase